MKTILLIIVAFALFAIGGWKKKLRRDVKNAEMSFIYKLKREFFSALGISPNIINNPGQVIANKVSSATRNAVNNAVNSAVNGVMGGNTAPAAVSATGNTAITPDITGNINYAKTFNRDHNWFKPIINDNFGGEYTIRENITMGELLPQPANSPYDRQDYQRVLKNFNVLDFVLYKNGTPVMVIDINRTKQAHRGARDLCTANNIGHLTFYTVYENNAAYVTARIKQALAG